MRFALAAAVFFPAVFSGCALFPKRPLVSNKGYQLGDRWGKEIVTSDSLADESAAFQRAAKATGHFGGGAAFYLGKFNGRHMMATNLHVAGSGGCGERKAEFVLLERSFPCEKVYGGWKEVDLSLFSIRVAPDEEAVLSGLGRNFAYETAIFPGQELLTIGFGRANNPLRRPAANQDSDCRVFSGRDEFRMVEDLDRSNPAGRVPDKVWSFANGCDISHGDSGSALIDRGTGDVLGIIWTAKVPKPARAADSRYLNELRRKRSEKIWMELSYAVPAARIRERLSAALKDGSLGADEAATLSALIGESGPFLGLGQ